MKDLPDGTMGGRGLITGKIWIDYLEILAEAGRHVVSVNHLTMIVEMHEDWHGTQNLKELQYMSKRPELEIKAYRGSYDNYLAIQGAPPPAPYLSMEDWDDYLGETGTLRRNQWDRAVKIYDPLQKIVNESELGEDALTAAQKNQYEDNKETLRDNSNKFFNSFDPLNLAEYDKNKETHLSCD